MTKMNITIKDIAKKAGVATSTVSRVINNHSNISEATKRKINNIMNELGYVPNLAARSLSNGKTNTIAIIFPPMHSKEEMTSPFFLEIVETINNEAQLFDLSVALAVATNFDNLLLNVKRMHKQKQVDGFILLYSHINDPIIHYLHKNKLMFTLVGLPCKDENNISYVDNDNQLLGKQATEYLIHHGHRRIVFITNRANEKVHFDRFFGYQNAMLLAKLAPLNVINIEKNEDITKISSFLKNNNITAAVVLGDLLAFRVIQHCNATGYSVPEKLSVISFNNTIFSSLVHPYITNIDINIELLGRYSLQKLMELLQGKSSHGMKIIVPHTLVKNETVITLSE